MFCEIHSTAAMTMSIALSASLPRHRTTNIGIVESLGELHVDMTTASVIGVTRVIGRANPTGWIDMAQAMRAAWYPKCEVTICTTKSQRRSDSLMASKPFDSESRSYLERPQNTVCKWQ